MALRTEGWTGIVVVVVVGPDVRTLVPVRWAVAQKKRGAMAPLGAFSEPDEDAKFY